MISNPVREIYAHLVPERQGVADGAVPLGGDGHHHEDGRGHGDVAQGVQQVGEGHGVPGPSRLNTGV